jgi:diguanylate cyclase (GGDEF)-like protein
LQCNKREWALFNFQQDNNAQISEQLSEQQLDQSINRGLALLVLITTSVVGSSWLFSLPVYFDIKIAAQILPVLFSLILLFLVTKIQHTFLNALAPVIAFIFVFCSWSYVIYLNSNIMPVIDATNTQSIKEAQYLGLSYAMYLTGLCFIIIWLGRYFIYSLYLSLISVFSLMGVLLLFTDIEIIYMLPPLLLLVSSSLFAALGLNQEKVNQVEVPVDLFDQSSKNDFLLSSEIKEEELKPELDINILPLNENSITHDWELILRELHSELKNTTDVDQLFKRMLVFLHGAMEFDAAAVGMLQDKSIRKIAEFGDDEYLHVQSLNWNNKRVKELFTLREPILSSQTRLSAETSNVTDPVHRLDVPVISNKKIVGLVTLFRNELIFDTHDIKLSASIVFHSMIALRQARMQEEIKRLNSESPEMRFTLYSREQFMTKVKPVFEKLSKPRECSLFIVEIDNLDTVIDKQGRDAGTLLYKATSKTIMSYLSERDLLGRYGNDGFVILLDETNLMHAKETAEKIRVKISHNKVKFQENVLTTTVSIGLTIVSDTEEDLPSLMRKADMGLFVAKENGSNTIKVSL